jgi:hypothetical protein
LVGANHEFRRFPTIHAYSDLLLLGALASHGITTPDSSKTIILAVAGFVANFIWTMYGTRLNGLLEQIKAKTGVQSIEIKVDPNSDYPIQRHGQYLAGHCGDARPSSPTKGVT